jgi:hypothetical protein
MHGVVSLLDQQATRMVESIGVELENELGLSSLYAPRIAHFSYHIMVLEKTNTPTIIRKSNTTRFSPSCSSRNHLR